MTPAPTASPCPDPKCCEGLSWRLSALATYLHQIGEKEALELVAEAIGAIDKHDADLATTERVHATAGAERMREAAAKEREACAKACEFRVAELGGPHSTARDAEALQCAFDIRARAGETTDAG